jgi:hypothetical protein
MRIALLNKQNRVTNVLALAPGVKPEDLRRVERWREAPTDHQITPGWRYDPKRDRFLPPKHAAA